MQLLRSDSGGPLQLEPVFELDAANRIACGVSLGEWLVPGLGGTQDQLDESLCLDSGFESQGKSEPHNTPGSSAG